MSDKCFNKYTKCKHNKMPHSPVRGLFTGFRRETPLSFLQDGAVSRGCSAQLTRKPWEAPPAVSLIVNATCVTMSKSILVS